MPAHTYVNILNFSFLLFIKKWGTQENLDIPKRSKLAFQKRSAIQACWSLILCSLRQASAPSAGHDVEDNADYAKQM